MSAHCRWCGGGHVDLAGHEENCVMRPRPVQLCEHYTCRCARAAELAELSDRTGRAIYLKEAVEVHSQLVRCRMSA